MQSFDKEFQNESDFMGHLNDILQQSKKPSFLFKSDEDDYYIKTNRKFQSYLKNYLEKIGLFNEEYEDFKQSYENISNVEKHGLSIEIIKTLLTFKSIVSNYCKKLFDSNDFTTVQIANKDVKSKGFIFSGNYDLDEEKTIDHSVKLEIARYCYKKQIYFIINCDFKQGFYDISPYKIVFDDDDIAFVKNDVFPTALIHADSKTTLLYNNAMETLIKDYYSLSGDVSVDVDKFCFDLINLENKENNTQVIEEFMDFKQNNICNLEYVSSFSFKKIYGSLILSNVIIENRQYFKLSLNVKKSSIKDILPIINQENYSKDDLIDCINNRNKFNFLYNITIDELVINSYTQNDIDNIIKLFPEFTVQDILNNLKAYANDFYENQYLDKNTKEIHSNFDKINLYLSNNDKKYYYHPICDGESDLYAYYSHNFDTLNNNDYLFVECFSGQLIPKACTIEDDADNSFDVLLPDCKPAFIVDLDNLKIISVNSSMEDLVVAEQSSLGDKNSTKKGIYSREQILQKWLFDSTTPVKINNRNKLHYAYQNLFSLTQINPTISYMVAPNNGCRLVLEDGKILKYVDDLAELENDSTTIYDRTLGCNFLQTPYVTINKITVNNKNYAILEYEILPLFATKYTKNKFIAEKSQQLSNFFEDDNLFKLVSKMLIDSNKDLFSIFNSSWDLITKFKSCNSDLKTSYYELKDYELDFEESFELYNYEECSESFTRYFHDFKDATSKVYDLLYEKIYEYKYEKSVKKNIYEESKNEVIELINGFENEKDILKIYHDLNSNIKKLIKLTEYLFTLINSFINKDFSGVTQKNVKESLEPDSDFGYAPELICISEVEHPILECVTQLSDKLKEQLDILKINKILADMLRQPSTPSLIADAKLGTIYAYNSRLDNQFKKYDEYLINNPKQTRYHVVGLNPRGYRFYERIREFFSPENYNPIENWDQKSFISYVINDFEINDDKQNYISNCFNQPIKVNIIPIKIKNETFALCSYTPLAPKKLPVQNYTKQQGMELWNEILNKEYNDIKVFEDELALDLLKNYYQASEVIDFGFLNDLEYSYPISSLNNQENKSIEESKLDSKKFFELNQDIFDKIPYKLDDKYKTAEFFETRVKFIDLKDSKTLKQIKQELYGKSNSIKLSKLGQVIYASQVFSPNEQVRCVGVAICSDKNSPISKVVLLINPIKHITYENNQLDLLHSVTRAITLNENIFHGKFNDYNNFNNNFGVLPEKIINILPSYWEHLLEEVDLECQRLRHEYGANEEELSKEPLDSLTPYWKSKKPKQTGVIITSLAESYVIPDELMPKREDYWEERRYTATPGVIVCFNWYKKEFNALLEQLEKEKPENEVIGSAWSSGYYWIDHLLEEAELLQFIKSQKDYSIDNWEQSTNAHLSKLLFDLKQNEYHVNLQAQVSLKEGDNWKCQGAEALIRRTDGSMTPDKFVPIFEEHGIVRHIDFFVLETICQTLQKWNKEHKNNLVDISFSVNLSRITLMEPMIVQSIAEICDKYEIPHSQIIMEVTEREGLIKSEVSKELIQEFKNNGYKVSLDDFGADTSNLSALAKISVDEVKVDKGLVDHIATHVDKKDSKKNTKEDKKIRSMVENVIKMCNNFGHDTITLAEGIENESQAEALRKFKCKIGQGYLFCKPIGLDEFYDEYIKNR